MTIAQLRKTYHHEICQNIIRTKHDSRKNKDYPNFADSGNSGSVQIATEIVRLLGCRENRSSLKGQTVGGRFESITKEFIEKAFELFMHMRPGNWKYVLQDEISNYDQYSELAALEKHLKAHKELASILGRDYIIKPDIIVGRAPVSNLEINRGGEIIAENDEIAAFTPLRESNFENPKPTLHASISCKWTIRSDRVQNSRAEALNLIRNRKGKTPHIVAVTAEPLPTRIASLALGTGDLDCVYHFALHELRKGIEKCGNEDQSEMLDTLIQGRRLRDISDLPFDLAI